MAYAALSLWLQGSTTLDARIAYWVNSVAHLTPWGAGIGSFWAEYPIMNTVETTIGAYSFDIRPRTAHNDALTVALETGLVGIALLVWFVVDVLFRPVRDNGDRAARLLVVTFLLLGLGAFPLYLPAASTMAALAAGYLCRSRGHLRDDGPVWRPQTQRIHCT